MSRNRARKQGRHRYSSYVAPQKKTSLHDITRTTFQPYPRCGPGRNRRISKRGAGGLKTRSHQPQQKEKLQSKRRAQVASLPFVICQADIRKMSLRIYPCWSAIFRLVKIGHRTACALSAMVAASLKTGGTNFHQSRKLWGTCSPVLSTNSISQYVDYITLYVNNMCMSL